MLCVPVAFSKFLNKHFVSMKLVRDTNKEIITRLGTKLDVKGIKFETGLEIDVSEKGKKEKQQTPSKDFYCLKYENYRLK